MPDIGKINIEETVFCLFVFYRSCRSKDLVQE